MTDPYRAVLVERICELVSWRAWYRRQSSWGYWLDLARDNNTELRALLAIARRARQVAALERDPIDIGEMTKAEWDRWTEPEMREAFGG